MPESDAFEADSELGDENDPEYKEEMFRTFRSMGWRPEDLTNDPAWAADYAEWLEKNPSDA